MWRLALAVVAIVILLVVTGAYLLQVTEESPGGLEIMSTRIGPVKATLDPGEAYSYGLQWRIVSSNPRDIVGKEYFTKAVPFQPSECKQLGIPLLDVKTSCRWWIFGADS